MFFPFFFRNDFSNFFFMNHFFLLLKMWSLGGAGMVGLLICHGVICWTCNGVIRFGFSRRRGT